MSTEIYFRIIKDVDPSDDVTGASLIAKLMSPIPLPGVICGDSLDMPFIKWMKLTGFKNSIGFDSGTMRRIEGDGDDAEVKSYDYGRSSSSYGAARTGGDDAEGPAERQERDVVEEDVESIGTIRRGRMTTGKRTGRDRFGSFTQKKTRKRSLRRAGRGLEWGDWGAESDWGKRSRPFLSNFSNPNNFLNINLPNHNSVSFSKRIDNATPQLAYACSCQEPIGTAMVLFRRRIGLGIRGIRVPFMAIMLSKCLLSDWELDGEDESCSMSYQEIRWCTYDQIADFNVATGMSARQWDTADNTGGESAVMYGVLGGIAAAAMLGAGLDTGISAAVSGGQGDTFGGGTTTERGAVDMVE